MDLASFGHWNSRTTRRVTERGTHTLAPVPGRTGGRGYVHAPGVKCGHRHVACGNNRQQVTCPACIRKLDAGAVAQFPKPRKPKPSTLFRLWNRRTGTWASDQRHKELGDAVREKITRVRAAEPRVQALARRALVLTTEGDIDFILRSQENFDTILPEYAAKRLTETPHRTLDGIRAELQPTK